MGFPVDYSEVFLPKLFVHALFFLGFLRFLLESTFDFLGLPNFLEPADQPAFFQENPAHIPLDPPISALLIRELLPAGKFSDGDGCGTAEMCAVCLYDFEGGEEIRWLKNCNHLFHRSCIDRWMDHNQRTCPLCRTVLVPRHMEKEFNQRLWTASAAGALDFEVDDYH